MYNSIDKRKYWGGGEENLAIMGKLFVKLH